MHEVIDRPNSITKRIHSAAKRIITLERLVEYEFGWTMMALENWHDMGLVPERYAKVLGVRPEQLGQPFVPKDPMMRWAVDNIGDIWEISVGFMGFRSIFILLNEGLRRYKGKEIPDDIQFLASLVPWTIIKAIHSLGYISLFGIHDHMDNPVPGMLFGQAVAATVLTAAHFGIKNRAQIKDFAHKSTALAGNLASRTASLAGMKIKEKKEAVNASIHQRVLKPAKETYTKIKTRLTNEWNSTPLDVRTSFKNASGALLLESMFALGGQNLQYPTLFLGIIGLLNGLSHKVNPAKDLLKT